MSLSHEQQEFVLDVARLIFFAEENGIRLTAGEFLRTKEQQKIYFETGKSKTMNSNHLRKLAVDFNFFLNGKLTYEKSKLIILGEYWESLNEKNRWGGNFKSFTDTPHFERNI